MNSSTQLLTAGIGFGSNVGDRLHNLRIACSSVLALPGVAGSGRASHLYETEPVDAEPAAGAFLNSVLELDYDGSPHSLLTALQSIEAAMGRPSKRPRNASRSIDLDLLYAGNLVLRNDEVVIPHPRLHRRRFVLAPLAEIRPELRLPGYEQTVAEMLKALEDPAQVRQLEEEWTP
ncbi:MAG TPA: 2-amino-4-hydroxy-6-hydroxymethyldihydropteridine diphosphokinase [Chthoniobacteraceae bacterium]